MKLAGTVLVPPMRSLAGVSDERFSGLRPERCALRIPTRAGFAVVAALLFPACFKPPEVVMVDRATALEQQAAGSFDELERRLDRAGIEPRPVPLTPEQVETLGLRSTPLSPDSERTDADRVDDLLVQHCIGEGNEGLLEETHDACKGATDADQLHTVVDRTNRARRQLFRFMHERKPNVPAAAVVAAWRTAHLRYLVCGGWFLGDDGKWAAKSC